MNCKKEVLCVCGVPLIPILWFHAQCSCFPSQRSLFIGQLHSRRDLQVKSRTDSILNRRDVFGLSLETQEKLVLHFPRSSLLSSSPSLCFICSLHPPVSLCLSLESPETQKRTAGVKHIERRVEGKWIDWLDQEGTWQGTHMGECMKNGQRAIM